MTGPGECAALLRKSLKTIEAGCGLGEVEAARVQ